MEIDEADQMPATPTLRHFTVRFYSDHADATGAYSTLGRTLFGDNKALIVCEGNIRGTTTKEHCHVQGYSSLSENQLAVKAREILKPFVPTGISRPLAHKQGDVTELGFQYMCKEYPPKILYQSQICDDEIEALADASKLLRAEKKGALGQVLRALALDPGMGARPCYLAMLGVAIKYYNDQDKMPPPNLKLLVKSALYKLDSDNPSWLTTVFEL